MPEVHAVNDPEAGDTKEECVNVQSQAVLTSAPFYWKEGEDVTACRASPVAGTWQGIGCNEKGAVINISLPGLNLGPAALPASFAQLSHLQEIDPQGNSLTGKSSPSAQLCHYCLNIGLPFQFVTAGDTRRLIV
jgi:hypothetical protein